MDNFMFQMFGIFWVLFKSLYPVIAIIGIIVFLLIRKARKNHQAEIDYLAKKIAEEMKKDN